LLRKTFAIKGEGLTQREKKKMPSMKKNFTKSKGENEEGEEI